ncbi:Transcriptional regulator, LysR family [hydrothermal vent metagenome]|uniref:Transcriptional regulator, LysR family n=1 Tax=hydrothermal vent metagenome TaxID=652676 RepID=A0A3B1A842_9ZZZZ
MDVSSLQLFVEVIQHRSFTDIARIHNIAPSSVSRSITALEKELGIRLFQRSTRKLEPTEAGMVYFNRVKVIIDDLQSARQIAADLTEQPSGTLRITAATVFGGIQIVPLLPKLAEKYPALTIDLNLTDSYLDLIDERIDVAIRLGTLQDSNYIAKRLAKMKFYICASPTYIAQHGTPETPHDISNHKCLVFPISGFNSNWLLKDTQQKIVEVKTNNNVVITNSNAIKQCTLFGMGLSLLPDWLVKDDISKGNLVQLFTEYDVTTTNYDSSVWLVYPSKEYLPLKSRVFIDMLSERFLQSAG